MVRLLKRRYIAFKLNTAPPVSKRDLATIFENMMITYQGAAGEQYHIRIIMYDSNSSLGIVRCDHKAVAFLLASLGSSKKYNIETIGMSGSIKALKRKFLKQ